MYGVHILCLVLSLEWKIQNSNFTDVAIMTKTFLNLMETKYPNVAHSK